MAGADRVVAATHEALVRLLEHAGKVGLANTEEFTFRSFFMAAAHDLLDDPRFQTEWRKVDLLVQHGNVATLIEFKYYLLRRTVHLDGTHGRAKGGAGLKNESEFRTCLSKLRTASPTRQLRQPRPQRNDRSGLGAVHRPARGRILGPTCPQRPT
jgi:hypothetical protein